MTFGQSYYIHTYQHKIYHLNKNKNFVANYCILVIYLNWLIFPIFIGIYTYKGSNLCPYSSTSRIHQFYIHTHTFIRLVNAIVKTQATIA